jgi:hypothetical protein
MIAIFYLTPTSQIRFQKRISFSQNRLFSHPHIPNQIHFSPRHPKSDLFLPRVPKSTFSPRDIPNNINNGGENKEFLEFLTPTSQMRFQKRISFSQNRLFSHPHIPNKIPEQNNLTPTSQIKFQNRITSPRHPKSDSFLTPTSQIKFISHPDIPNKIPEQNEHSPDDEHLTPTSPIRFQKRMNIPQTMNAIVQMPWQVF